MYTIQIVSSLFWKLVTRHSLPWKLISSRTSGRQNSHLWWQHKWKRVVLERLCLFQQMSPIRHSQGWRVVVGITTTTEKPFIFQSQQTKTSDDFRTSTWRRFSSVVAVDTAGWGCFLEATTTTNSSREEELNTQISSRSWSVVAAMAHQSFPPWQLYMGCCTGCSFRAGTTTSFSLFKRRILLKIHHPTRIKPRLRSFFIINLINFVSKAEES